jgi:hypothetical protein
LKVFSHFRRWKIYENARKTLVISIEILAAGRRGAGSRRIDTMRAFFSTLKSAFKWKLKKNYERIKSDAEKR